MPAKKKVKKRRLVNLLPQKEFEVSYYGRILKWLLSTFRFIVVAVEAVVILGFLSRFTLDVQNTDLADEIRTNQTVIESFGSFEKEFRRAQEKIEVFKAYAVDEQNSGPIVLSVVRRMPTDVKLTSVSLRSGEVSVLAQGSDEQSIAQFVSNLSTEPGFGNISLVLSESNIDEDLIRFQLRMDLIKKGGV